MSYEKRISRQFAALIGFVLDDSGSMDECLQGTSDEKFQWVERLTAILFKELLMRSTEIKGETAIVKPRYHVFVVKYGSKPEIWGDGIMDIEAVVKRYSESQNSLGLSGKLGGTDSRAALTMARDLLKSTGSDERFRESFPPMLFHLTDGESATDARNIAEEIKQISTTDGNVILVNAYIGTQTSLSYKGPEDFPGYQTEQEAGPSDDNIRLFEMSSEFPFCIQQNLIEDGIFPSIREKCRGFFDIRTKDMLKHAIQVVGSVGSRADRSAR